MRFHTANVIDLLLAAGPGTLKIENLRFYEKLLVFFKF